MKLKYCSYGLRDGFQGHWKSLIFMRFHVYELKMMELILSSYQVKVFSRVLRGYLKLKGGFR